MLQNFDGQNDDMTSCIVVLCGLPGSGKSSLSKNLKKYIDSNLSSIYHCCLVEYDALIPACYTSENSHQTQTWKEYRVSIAAMVADLVRQIATPRGTRAYQAGFVVCPCAEGGASNASIKHLLILDDNFYYRSMRHEIWRIAEQGKFFCLGGRLF